MRNPAVLECAIVASEKLQLMNLAPLTGGLLKCDPVSIAVPDPEFSRAVLHGTRVPGDGDFITD